MKKLIIPVLMMLTVVPAMAQNKAPELPDLNTMVESIGTPLLYVILGVSVILLILVSLIYYLVAGLRDKVMAELDPSYVPKSQQSIWGKIFQVKPTSTDKDVVLEHSYDNIVELNNPIPGWFMVLFYITVVFAVGYMFNYHVFKYSKLQEAEYTTEVEKAKAEYEVYLKTVGDKINAETVTLLTDAAEIAKGKEMYLQNCKACHGDAGQGNQIGPNLTDEYWLHGGGVKNVFKTISEGVQQKGMQSWKKKFSPAQIQQLASFVISMQGTNPPDAKAPQGEKWTKGGTASPAAGEPAKTDSANVQLSLN